MNKQKLKAMHYLAKVNKRYILKTEKYNNKITYKLFYIKSIRIDHYGAFTTYEKLSLIDIVVLSYGEKE